MKRLCHPKAEALHPHKQPLKNMSGCRRFALHCEQVILRRKMCVRFADDGGAGWTTVQHGRRAGRAVAGPAAAGGVLEHYEEVLLSQSELGLSAGAYAWNSTAR